VSRPNQSNVSYVFIRDERLGGAFFYHVNVGVTEREEKPFA
jgi:hypothetical protein